MSALIGAYPKAENQRFFQLISQAQQIADSHHNICGLVSRGISGDVKQFF